MKLFDVLPNFPFTRRETISNFYLETWYIRVTSQAAKRLKAYDLSKLGNITKLSKDQRMIA